MTAKSEPVSTELTRSIRRDLDRFHRGAQMTFDREDILDVLDMYERSLANRADLAAENERLRAHIAILTEEGHREIERLRAALIDVHEKAVQARFLVFERLSREALGRDMN